MPRKTKVDAPAEAPETSDAITARAKTPRRLAKAEEAPAVPPEPELSNTRKRAEPADTPPAKRPVRRRTEPQAPLHVGGVLRRREAAPPPAEERRPESEAPKPALRRRSAEARQPEPEAPKALFRRRGASEEAPEPEAPKALFRRRGASEKAPEPEAPKALFRRRGASEEAPELEPPKALFRRRGASEEAPEPAAPRTRRTVRERTPRRESEVEPEPKAARGRSRRKPEEPALQVRKLVPVPEGAPQVVVVDGVPTLIRDNAALSPLMFFCSAQDKEALANMLEQARMAFDAGVQIFGHLVEIVVEPGGADDAASFTGYLLKRLLEVAPGAQNILRVVFVAPKGWERRFAKAKFVAEDGGLAEPSLCDDEFWGEAEACLRSFVAQLRMLPERDHLLGLHLDRGEWFFPEGVGYDTSIAAHDKFRDWVRVRYRDDVVALRSSWFDGQAQFQTVSVPPYSGEVRAGEEFVRTSRKARRFVDYNLFLSDVTVERIGILARAVKEASEGHFLVGVSYGYTFEWSHPANGHLSLGKLLRNPEVDFIGGPPSYRSREPGGSAPFPCPVDSFALNGKLFISEEDFKTPISGKQEPDDFNPPMRTPQALESAHWRGVGSALAHLNGVSWMDLWGNGWLGMPGIWQRASQALQILEQRRAAPVSDPDVAVFIDERSLAYLVDQRAFSLLVQNVREAIIRSGLSTGFYLLSDLAHRESFPESRLHVFLNAWDIRPEVRGAIKSRLQRDGKVLFWLYCAGMFDAGRDALERVREVTAIALRRQPFGSRSGSTLLHRHHPLCEALPEAKLQEGGSLEPSYFAIPEDALVLAEYNQTGLPSFVMRDYHAEDHEGGNWKSVFLGEAIVTPALFRALGQMAGAHIWSYQDDVTHVRPPYLLLHATGAAQRTITLPRRWSAYDVRAGTWAAMDATNLRFQAGDGTSQLFLVGAKPEIEMILARDLDTLRRIEHVPPRRENTLHLDQVNFDVPIMRLDEWIEESDSDGLSDDLIFRPPVLDDEPYPESAGIDDDDQRSRRRRRRGESGDETPPRRRAPEGADDLPLSVVFRKRS